MAYINTNIEDVYRNARGPNPWLQQNQNPFGYSGSGPMDMFMMMPLLIQMLMGEDSPFMQALGGIQNQLGQGQLMLGQGIVDYAPPEWFREMQDARSFWESDQNQYLAQNPDVQRAYLRGDFGSATEDQAAYQHAQRWGAFENRDTSMFDSNLGVGAGASYFANNPDVKAAYDRGDFGQVSPLEAAQQHAQRWGQSEGRDTSMFQGLF